MFTDVLVIGAGQAGLSAAYHLQRRGFVPLARAGEAERRAKEENARRVRAEAAERGRAASKAWAERKALAAKEQM